MAEVAARLVERMHDGAQQHHAGHAGQPNTSDGAIDSIMLRE
jgi:hypothetical protein